MPPLRNFAITHLILGLHFCALVTLPIKLFHTRAAKQILIKCQGLAVKGGYQNLSYVIFIIFHNSTLRWK